MEANKQVLLSSNLNTILTNIDANDNMVLMIVNLSK